MLIVNLIKQEWKKSYRAQGYYKNLAVSIMLGFFVLYMAVVFLFMGFALNSILEKADNALNPMELFNGGMLYLILAGLVIRFLMQPLNTFNLPPYQLLPIKRSTLINFLLLKPLANPVNYFLLLVVVPFAVKSVVGYYSVLMAVKFILSFIFIIWFNSLTASYLKRKFGNGLFQFILIILIIPGFAALEYFKLLEQQAENPKNNASAVIGEMHCNYQLKNYAEAIDYAKKVLGLERTGTELMNESHYIIAKSDFSIQENNKAHSSDSSKFDLASYDRPLQEFQIVAECAKNVLGAESEYNVAYINYLQKNYKQSEKIIFDFINSEGDYPYWVTKALILLADNYLAVNDNFQAKTTLKSIISDSDVPELIKFAQDKLDKITAAEEAAKQTKTVEEPIKIKFEGDSTEQKKLFTEPVQQEIKK